MRYLALVCDYDGTLATDGQVDGPTLAALDRLLSTGRVIVASWRPHEIAILEAIRDLGLELQVIFNKDAVMVLPAGVNKATGLTVALEELGLSPHNAVGVGDAENDHAFLTLCECSVAVANALPALKETADYRARGTHGDGVAEVVELLLGDEPALLPERRVLTVGEGDPGPVALAPAGEVVLVAGRSGSGK